MATTRKTTNTKTVKKTKTKPSSTSKPATKVTTKATPKTVNKKTTTKTSSAKNTSATTAPAKSKHGAHKAIFISIVTVAILAVIAGIIGFAICKYRANNGTVMFENGEGEKIKAEYTAINGSNYHIAIPIAFSKSDDEDATKTMEAVYVSSDSRAAAIAVSKSVDGFSNDQVKEYTEALATINAPSATVLESKTYESGSHTVGVLALESKDDNTRTYNRMAVFSDNDKLVLVSFSCQDDACNTWEKVGEGIIDNITFDK